MISIIVLTYNAWSYTEKCLNSIKANTFLPYELIVIDNCSTDGTQEKLLERAKTNEFTHLVLNKDNLGVAGGRNLGISLAKQEYVVFLDNDTEVSKGWDNALISGLQQKGVGIIGKDGTHIRQLAPIKLDVAVGRECDVCAGFCFAFKRQLVGEIGNQWDKMPNGKFWHEDLEFCLRAKLLGYDTIQKRDIQVKHFGHKSMPVDSNGQVIFTDGFVSNAKYVQSRLRGSNILRIHRDYREDRQDSYDIVLRELAIRLRDKGLVVLWDKPVTEDNKSFGLCKGCDMSINGQRLIWLHQENDRPPMSWRESMETVDYAFCASPFVIEACGSEPYSKKLVNVSPNGVDMGIFNTSIEPMQEVNGIDLKDKFVFLMVGATQPRKNSWDAMRMFYEVYANNPDVVLIVKEGGTYGWHQKTKEALQAMGNPKNIIWVQDSSWTRERLASLYRRAAIKGAYYSPHRGECFGLPIVEAMACGSRVGVTNYGGAKYIFDGVEESGVGLFGYKMQKSTYHNWAKEPFYLPNEDPQWAVANSKEVKEWLESVVKQKWGVKDQERVSKYVNGKYNYDMVADRMYKEIIKIVKKSL